MSGCTLCPRRCGVSRENGNFGVCGMPKEPVLARAALHFGEEPCISGTRGSGAVFFSGCPMHCIFCQNRDISIENRGRQGSVARLCEIFLALQSEGAENINLVTPLHFAPAVAEALRLVKGQLSIPVVCNTGAYDTVETLRLFRGLVDVYLPDFKYASASLAGALSRAPDYPEIAQKAIAEMQEQTGGVCFDANGMLQKGVLVRHLVLPGHSGDSLRVLELLSALFEEKTAVRLSLMRQYTPQKDCPDPTLQRTVTTLEYRRVLERAAELGFLGYSQRASCVGEEYLPAFDGTGV